MKVLVVVVLWLAIVVALPTNRIKDGHEDDAPIRRAKRSDSMSLDMNGFSYSHALDVFENKNFAVDATITAYKNWMTDKFAADLMSGQLNFLHKKSGLNAFLGADQQNNGDVLMRLGGSKDIIVKKDYSVGVSGQYNMDYNKYTGVQGDYSVGLNGRYRKFNWDMDRNGFDVHKMTPLLSTMDKTIVADVGVQKGWHSDSWQTYLPDVLTSKLQYLNNKYHLTAYIGLNKLNHNGGSIFTGLSFPVWLTRTLRGELSTGYSWSLGRKDDGQFTIGFNMRF